MNVAIVRGRLSSEPRVTEFESGDVLVRLEVTVPRDDGPADSVPVAWIGPPKQQPSAFVAGDEVLAIGRIRRRWYRTPRGNASATELVAATVVPPARRSAARRVAASARAELEELGG